MWGVGCPSVSPCWCSWLLLPCLKRDDSASPDKGSACPAAVPSLFYERKLSQLMVLTSVGHCCFSYPLSVSLENSLKQKHKMGFVEMCELTWSLQNLRVYFWKQNNSALQLAVFGSTAQLHGCSRPCETGR